MVIDKNQTGFKRHSLCLSVFETFSVLTLLATVTVKLH
jgi:hypothetical protein